MWHGAPPPYIYIYFFFFWWGTISYIDIYKYLGPTSSSQQQPAKSQQPTASSKQPSICCIYWLAPLPKQKPTHQAYTSEQAPIKRRGALCCKWQSFLGLHGVKKKGKPNPDPIGPRLGLQWAFATMSTTCTMGFIISLQSSIIYHMCIYL